MNSPFGIFDSGIGGLTVLKELKRRLPGEKFIYFGDTGRVPYGNKGRQTVTRYSVEIANFLLINHNIKVLVVACNTASSLAVEALKRLYRIPVFEVVVPAVKRAVQETRNGKIGVIGTSSTVRSNTYRRMIKAHNSEMRVYQKACPLFVPIVEEGWVGHFVTDEIVRHYLTPLKKKGVDTLILGCTHYPFMRDKIESFLGQRVKIVDSASNVAREVERYGRKKGLSRAEAGEDVLYLVTDDPAKFREHGERLLGERPRDVRKVTF